MASEHIFQRSGLEPAQIEHVRLAYTEVLRQLHLVDRNDPIAEMIAKKVIRIGRECGDPIEIAKTAMRELRR